MKEIELSRNKVAIVDDSDFNKTNQYKWHACFDGWNWYAKARVNGKDVFLHRFILGTKESTSQIDHINRNGLDCRKSNLRFCSPSENGRNRKIRSDNTSGFRGVNFHKGKWQARIKINGHRIELGHFDSPELAAIAYNAVVKKYHGEFAVMNEIGITPPVSHPLSHGIMERYR